MGGGDGAPGAGVSVVMDRVQVVGRTHICADGQNEVVALGLRLQPEPFDCVAAATVPNGDGRIPGTRIRSVHC